MKKLFEKIKNCKITPYFIILVASMIVCSSFLFFDWSFSNDGKIHIARIIATGDILKMGIFPPIINFKLAGGFGYGINLFYGPLTTYVPLLISFFSGCVSNALNITSFLVLFFSSFTMYHFVYSVTKSKKASIISALIYLTMPYHLEDACGRVAIRRTYSFCIYSSGI